MEILLASDIHINHNKHPVNSILSEVPRDLTIILGDVSTTLNTFYLEKFITYLLDISDVIFILGNHEHHSADFYETPVIVQRIFDNLNLKCKHIAVLLHNDEIVYNDVRFIGTTLWSGTDLYNKHVVKHLKKRMRFYKSKSVNLSAYDLFIEYCTCLKYLLNSLKNPYDGKTVVLTHHAPSMQSISPDFKECSHVNSVYASDLDNIMHSDIAPDYWFHGHVHNSMDYMINNTRIVCNPYGYTKTENTGFDPQKVVKIDDFRK